MSHRSFDYRDYKRTHIKQNIINVDSARSNLHTINYQKKRRTGKNTDTATFFTEINYSIR